MHAGVASALAYIAASVIQGSVVGPPSFIIRAHSFTRPAEFRAEPRNLGFPRNLTTEFFFQRNAAEFDVFHSNNYFFTENYLKVALLQVSL